VDFLKSTEQEGNVHFERDMFRTEGFYMRFRWIQMFISNMQSL